MKTLRVLIALFGITGMFLGMLIVFSWMDAQLANSTMRPVVGWCIVVLSLLLLMLVRDKNPVCPCCENKAAK